MINRDLFLVLHNIRSAYNVGAILRTADGAGVKKVYLSGYTCCPKNNEKIQESKAEKMIAKTALGAEKSVSWEKVEDLSKLMDKFRKEKITIVSLEKTQGAIDLKKFKPQFPSVLLVGNEVEGVPEEILKISDKVISIPMRGKKESLNVSVATGIAVYEILK